MWGFCGIAGLLSVLLIGVWCFAYFRSEFGPLYNNEDNWVAGLVNIRVHQLVVLSVGSMAAITLGKWIAIGLQFLYLTARMGRMQGRVKSLTQRMKDRQFLWGQQFLGLMGGGDLNASEYRSESFANAGLLRGPRRILICQASVGAGHKRAAEAIEAAFHLDYPDIDVKTIDVMDEKFADPVFKYFYKDTYLRFVSGQSMWGGAGTLAIGFLFDRSNQIVKGQLTGGGFLNNRRLCMSMVLSFLDFLCDYEPDMIVHTHFLSAEIIAGLRRHNGYTVPQVTVVTDMDVHAWWYQQPCEKYFVPRGLAQCQLELHGVPSKDIEVTGIPILPCFEEVARVKSSGIRAEMRSRFAQHMDCSIDVWASPDDERPIVLLMSTGVGLTSHFQNLLQLRSPAIIIVICGRQADVRS
jgi:hypothetical protein